MPDSACTSTIHLPAWSAWAPGLPDPASWKHWLAGAITRNPNKATFPPCRNAPALLRRRFSLLTRMFLESAFQACTLGKVDPAQVNLIFNSRYGDMQILRRMFDDMHLRSPLSPTQFSNSVHHTPCGYFELIAGNQQGSRAISASSDALVVALLEVQGLLASDPEVPCLLVFADEMPPEPFNHGLTGPEFPFAMAFVFISSSDPRAVPLHCHKMNPTNEIAVVDEFDFLRWLAIDPKTELRMETPYGCWLWTK